MVVPVVTVVSAGGQGGGVVHLHWERGGGVRGELKVGSLALKRDRDCDST